MEELHLKVDILCELLKAARADLTAQKVFKPNKQTFKIPEIKAPSTPSTTSVPKTGPKVSSGVVPSGQKDPNRIAAQIASGQMSTKTQKLLAQSERLTIAKNGQWSLDSDC